MKKLLKYTACLAMLVMVLALLTGCADKATGGGWFYTGCGEENKVTFGFNAQLVEEGVYKGQFQVKNHGTGEKFHMSEVTFAFALGDFVGYFSGEEKDGGKVKVTITDLGQPRAYIGDSIIIWTEKYGTWAGSLEGGNIQLHEEKD